MMDWITIVGVIAATLTILSFLYMGFVRVRRFMKAMDARLVALEDTLTVREELVLKDTVVVLNEGNNKIYTLEAGTIVIVYDINDDIVEFVTQDRLITAKSNINNFKQEKNE